MCRIAAKESGVEAGAGVHAEWSTLACLLAQVLEAHVSTFPPAAQPTLAALLQLLWAGAAPSPARCNTAPPTLILPL